MSTQITSIAATSIEGIRYGEGSCLHSITESHQIDKKTCLFLVLWN